MNSTTKNKILDSATFLFNRDGVFNVSLRMIADEMGISVGNLTYHFRKKEDLISEIVIRLTKDRNIYGYPANISMSEFNGFLENLQKRHEEYSFFYMNLADLTQKYQVVRDAEIRANSEINLFYHQVLNTFALQKLIVPEKYPFQYTDLTNNMVMVSTFWSQVKIVTANFPQHKKSLVKMIWSIIIPAMTEEGDREYREKIAPLFAE